jgi:hypothetical protein
MRSAADEAVIERWLARVRAAADMAGPHPEGDGYALARVAGGTKSLVELEQWLAEQCGFCGLPRKSYGARKVSALRSCLVWLREEAAKSAGVSS